MSVLTALSRSTTLVSAENLHQGPARYRSKQIFPGGGDSGANCRTEVSSRPTCWCCRLTRCIHFSCGCTIFWTFLQGKHLANYRTPGKVAVERLQLYRLHVLRSKPRSGTVRWPRGHGDLSAPPSKKRRPQTQSAYSRNRRARRRACFVLVGVWKERSGVQRPLTGADLGFENRGGRRGCHRCSSVKCGAQIGHSQAKNRGGETCAPPPPGSAPA